MSFKCYPLVYLHRSLSRAFRCIEYATGAKHPDDAGALIESIAEKLKAAGMTEVCALSYCC